MTPPVTVADFKARFPEFPYGTASGTVTDGMITNALNDACSMFNVALWNTGIELNTMFLFLAAHCLAQNVQAGGGLGLTLGAQNAGGAPINSRSVGSVSVGYQLPDKWVNDPTISPFLMTTYGIRYVQAAYPRMRGNMAVIGGFSDLGAPTGV